MKKLIIVTGLFFLVGCSNTNQQKISLLVRHIDSLNKNIDSLNNEISDDRELIKNLMNEIQFRESEISFWGHKLDSCKAGYK